LSADADAAPAPTIEVARECDQSSLKRVARIARRDAEGMMIMRMLQQTRGNRRQAAINLGISYKAFQYKAKEHVNRE
jgi:DNA-binding NtrC family response regulator